MHQSSCPFLTRAHGDVSPVETLVFVFLLQNSTPSPRNMRPTPLQEPICMTLIVDSFSTSSGFISSCDPGITAGHPGGPDGCLSLPCPTLWAPAPRVAQLRKVSLAAEALISMRRQEHGPNSNLSPSVANHQRAAGNAPQTSTQGEKFHCWAFPLPSYCTTGTEKSPAHILPSKGQELPSHPCLREALCQVPGTGQNTLHRVRVQLVLSSQGSH